MVASIQLKTVDERMPYYKLFHNGVPCKLAIKELKEGEGGKCEVAFDFIPVEPTPADTVAFERMLVTMGFKVSVMDQNQRATLRAVWNMRGIVDAEAVASASAGEDTVGLERAVGSILRNSK